MPNVIADNLLISESGTEENPIEHYFGGREFTGVQIYANWVIVKDFVVPPCVPGQPCGAGMVVYGDNNVIGGFEIQNRYTCVKLTGGNNNLIDDFVVREGGNGVYLENNSNNNIIRSGHAIDLNKNGNWTGFDGHSFATNNSHGNLFEDCRSTNNRNTHHAKPADFIVFESTNNVFSRCRSSGFSGVPGAVNFIAVIKSDCTIFDRCHGDVVDIAGSKNCRIIASQYRELIVREAGPDSDVSGLIVLN